SNDITTATLLDSSLIDSAAETRIAALGYSVDDNVANGTANSYTFTLDHDTIVKFNSKVEHALRIQRDPYGTEGTADTNGTPGQIQGLSSDAAGNPGPGVQQRWSAENESVVASIGSEVAGLAYQAKGLPVKYVVTSYDAFGPPNTKGTAGTSNRIDFIGSDQ